MFIDFRYHIASLVAVFMALGIGILIGSTMLGDNGLYERQDQIAERLEQHLNQLRQENEEVRVQLAALESEASLHHQVSKDFLTYLVAGQLQGVRLAVIETSTYQHEQDLRPLFEMAGADIQSITTVNNGFELAGRKEAILSLAGWEDMPDRDLVRRLASATAEQVLAGRSELIDYLVHEDLLTVTGEYGLPVDAVVFVGGSHDGDLNTVSNVDVPMLNYFAKQGIMMVGVEESVAVGSYMKEYQRKCGATVDNVDSVAGQFSLVMALAGRGGHYGVKETAQKLIPSL